MRVLLLVLLLSGCAHTERNAYYAAECQKAGYQPETPEYNGCVKVQRQRDMKAMVVFPIR